MKSERREELENNSLARALSAAPGWLNKHLNKILIAFVVLMLGVFLYRWNEQQEAGRQQLVAEELAAGLQELQSLQRLPGRGGVTGLVLAQQPDVYVQLRDELVASISDRASRVLLEAELPSVKAAAVNLRGDLQWALATLPEPPAAATQPTLGRPQPAEEYLADAETNYRAVLADYADAHQARTHALFGLAAIAENRRDFEEAASLYARIAEDESANSLRREYARLRRLQVLGYGQPLLIGMAASADLQTLEDMPLLPIPTTAPTDNSTEQPSEAPSAEEPSPAPSTQPAE
ncbi:MAG: hypothetical protein ACFCVE_10720 [Phycisphaerae bacterium]